MLLTSSSKPVREDDTVANPIGSTDFVRFGVWGWMTGRSVPIF